jgi:predicted HTH transcriptional regulator
MKGSYIRIGDSDEPMTDYEIYSYEAFGKKCQDDVRSVPRATFGVLDPLLLEEYMIRLKREKPSLSAIDEKSIYELIGITRDGQITISSLFLFCKYPQVFFPQLCITAVVVPGEEVGKTLSQTDAGSFPIGIDRGVHGAPLAVALDKESIVLQNGDFGGIASAGSVGLADEQD